jgi:hypothetical protein
MDDYTRFLVAASIASICPREIVSRNSTSVISRTTRSKRSMNIKKIVEKKANIESHEHPFVPITDECINLGEFWNHVDRNCEIFPTIIPVEHLHLYWFNLALIFGYHYPNRWLERKEVLQLVGTSKNHSMRGCLIPRATTVSDFFPPLQDASRDPPRDSLIMMKTGNLHYFMVWQPIMQDFCPGVTSGCKCPNPKTCFKQQTVDDFLL